MDKNWENGDNAKLPCPDCWTWHTTEHSHEVILTGKHWKTAHFYPTWSSGTAAVRGTRLLNHGRFYWELNIPKRIFGTSMMFGIGTKKARLHENSFVNLIGIDENSWGLSHKGLLWHKECCRVYTDPFRENVSTRIGVLFDGIAGTLTYFKDNKCLGVAFKGLQKVREPLYPMVCSTAVKTEMTLENTRRDFVNLQDRCRAVIVDCVKRQVDVDELGLPKKLCDYLKDIMDDDSWRQRDDKMELGPTLAYLESNFLNSMPRKQH